VQPVPRPHPMALLPLGASTTWQGSPLLGWKPVQVLWKALGTSYLVLSARHMSLPVRYGVSPF